MSWFQKLCRNTGLMIHGITQPAKDDAKDKPKTKVVRHEVEEEERDGVTLRRTTIEEIEMKPGATIDPGPEPPDPKPE